MNNHLFRKGLPVTGYLIRQEEGYFKSSKLGVSALTKRIGLLIGILLFTNSFLDAATYYSRQTGLWSANTTWSLASGGGAVGAGVYPVAGDIVIIERGWTVTVDLANTYCASVQLGSTVNNTSSGTLTFQANTTLNVSGAVAIGSNGNAGRTGTITFVNNSTLTTGSVTLGGPAGTPAAGTITMTAGGTLSTGSLAVNTVVGNTWTPGTGTVRLTATNTLPATVFTSFNNLTVASGTTSLSRALTITNNLYLMGSSTLTTGNFQITGNAVGTLALDGGSTLQLGFLTTPANAFPTNYIQANITLNSGSTVEYSGAGAQTVSNAPSSYSNLTISGGNFIKTLGGAVAVNGRLFITGNSTLATNTFNIAGNTTGTLDMDSGTTLTLGAVGSATPVSFPSNFSKGNITLDVTSTIIYQANTAQTVSATPDYGNLTLSTGAAATTKTSTGDVRVNGNLIVNANTTLSLGTSIATWNIAGNMSVVATGTMLYDITAAKTINLTGSFIAGTGVLNMSGGNLTHVFNIAGDYANTGTFTPGTGSTVNYYGASQSIRSTTYNNLTVSNSGTKTLAGAITVANNLYITGTSILTTGNVQITGNVAGTLVIDNGAKLQTGFFATPANAFPTLFTQAHTTLNAGSTVEYNGAGLQTISNVPASYSNLIVSGSNTKTLAGAISVGGNLLIQGTAVLASDIYQITGNATGQFDMDAGTGMTLGNTGNVASTQFPTAFIAANIILDVTSNVTYQANAAQTISVTPTYGNLILTTGNAANSKTATGILNIGGNLTVTNGAANATLAFGASATTINVFGDLAGTGIINMTGAGLAHSLYLSGINNVIGTFNTTPGSGSTVNYNGLVNQQVFASVNYRNLTISGSGIKTLTNAITVNNNLYITESATLATGGGATNLITGNATGTFSMDAGTTLTLGDPTSAGAITFPSTFTTGNISFNSTSTVVYQANTAQTISVTPNYGNLTLSTGAAATAKTSAGNLTVNGNFALTNGPGIVTFYVIAGASTCTIAGNITGNGALNMSTGTNPVFNIGGDYSNTGGFTPGTSTINYNGSTIGQIVRGGITYNNLQISNGGSKLLVGGATTVANILTLNSGVFQLNDNNLTLSLNTTAAIAGSAGSVTNMIETNGTGSLIKTGGAAGGGCGLNMIYPIGSGGYYNPLDLGTTGSFTAAAGLGNLTLRVVTINQGAQTLRKYWSLNLTGYTGIISNLRFAYVNPDEVSGTQSSYATYLGAALGPANRTALGANPFGSNVVGVTAATITGNWTASNGVPGVATATTYYSYQSGDWSHATSWTTDPSGTIWVNPGVPSSLDNVVILNGRTITINQNSKVITTLEIKDGGILDVNTTTGHNFGTVIGQGKLQIASTTFPAGTFTSFVSATGGTIELNNASSFTIATPATPANTFNNLIINLPSTSLIATLLSNLTLNGDLTIQSGVFQINDGTANARTISIAGDVSVSSNGKITLGTGNVNHRFIVGGDFTNNGIVRFTNQAAPVLVAYYTTPSANGRADAVFNNGTKDQSILCNNTTDFYRIEINKGTDQTYILNIDASATSNFALYGPNNSEAYTVQLSPNTPNTKALGLLTGTLRLGSNIVIPCLVSGNFCYFVDGDCQLWLDDNASVTLKTATLAGWNDAMYVYGKVRFSGNCTFDATTCRMGIACRETADFEIESGTISVLTIRPSAAPGTHRGAFKMYGGTFTVTGYDLAGLVPDQPSMSFPYPDNVFIMTGGVIDIQTSRQAGGNANSNDFSLTLGMNVANSNVTGGTIRIGTTASFAYINSNVALPNLEIYGTGNYCQVQATGIPNGTNLNTAKDLTVVGNLTLQNTTELRNTNNVTVSVGGNFTVPVGTIYSPNINTTIFNGSGNQVFTNSGTITNGLNNLTISNSSNTSITNNLKVNATITINSGTQLDDNSKYIYAGGNVVNSGRHVGQLTTGGMSFNGTSAQTISGNGIFNNLIIDKPNTSGVLLSNDISITGNLRLITNANFNIGSNNLSLAAGSNIYTDYTSAQNYDNTHMVSTAGLASDGGLTKTYSSLNKTFIYPIGIGTNYRKASVSIGADPTQFGSITIRPILSAHPLIQNTPPTHAINLYWKTTSSLFTGIQNGSISQVYYYNASDAAVPADESTYIPASYQIPNWVTISNTGAVLDGITPREIHFDNVNYLDGEYTCGTGAAFSGLNVYYSNSNNVNISTGIDWNAASTWCTGSNSGTPIGALADNMSNAVFIIGDGSATIHKINISGAHHIITGNILIKSNGILDLAGTNGHNFGSLPNTTVSGTGVLRIASTNYFPTGDWGDFLGGSGGTIEYYQTATGSMQMPSSYTLPSGGTASITGYYNLITSPWGDGNSRIILPNTSLTVYNDFTVGYNAGGGTTRCNTLINIGANSRTVEVIGNVNVNQNGVLQFNGDATLANSIAQFLIVDGDINIVSGGAIQVYNGNSNVINTLNSSGNISNNGIFNLNPAGTFRCDLTFTGASNKTLSGTTASITRFYNITTNKGIDRNSVIDITVNTAGFNFGGALTLTSGTFRLTSAATMNLSTGVFSINDASCLSANGGIFNIATSVAASADLNLNGRLEVKSTGTINVGPAIANGTGNAFNIVYSSGGSPEIIVSGSGILNVFSQIRRGATIPTGSLCYTQSGGTVTVGGKNGNAARGVFEVLNSGSKFAMSSGTLIIANHITAASPYDLDIEPDTVAVTGGTVQLGLATITPNQTLFYIQSSCPLGNLTLDANTNAQAIQQVYPLTVLGNLTIGGVNSYYNTNSKDVTIGGNLINNNTTAAANNLTTGGYRAQVATQNTTFNGSVDQSITGTNTPNRTNFGNLVVNPTTGHSLILTSNPISNITVNGDLSLLTGTLNDGANTIYLLKNVDNNATHTSSNATLGGMLFSGSVDQVISGSGSGVFGNIEINNSGGKGINMIDNSTINGQLKFTTGYFYIDDYTLTFGQAATIAGSPGTGSNQIRLNGVISDAGVVKIFPTGIYTFTFPVGVAGKYTPVTFNFASNSNPAGATIRVITVNTVHPTINPATYLNYLSYYWNIKATGFTSAFNLSQSYTYNVADVHGAPANIERYDNSTFLWGTVAGSMVSPSFSFSSTTLLDGEYTIGDAFTSLPPLYSRVATGNWGTVGTWSYAPGGSGATCGCTPNGNPVVIEAGQTISLATNSAYAHSVSVIGTLDAKNTTFHNIGHVTGSGLIRLQSTSDGMFVFPGGEYDTFFATTSSTLEFYGSNGATLPLKPGNIYKPYQNVIISGTGIKYMSAENMKISGNLTISNNSKLNNTLYNKDLFILGNWSDSNTAAGGFTAGTGKVSFDGTVGQTFSMPNNTVKEIFYNLSINNTSTGLTIFGGNIDVNSLLYLTLGNITTSASNSLTINNTSTSAIVGGSVNSFVNGPLKKKIMNGSSFLFPVGDATSQSRNRFGYVSINNTSTTGTQIWTTKFVDKDPTSDGYNRANFQAPLGSVSDNEYWSITGPSSGSAKVVVSWDQYSGMSSSAPARAKSRLAEWNTPVPAKWNSAGQVVTDFGQTSGNVGSSTLINLAGTQIFTIGATSMPIAQITSSSLTVCNDGVSTAWIQITITGATATFSYIYSIDGVNQTAVTGISSPSTVNFNISNLITTGNHIIKLESVWDANNEYGSVNAPNPVTVTLKPVPTNTITGNTTVSNGTTLAYTTTPDATTYSWSLDACGNITGGAGTASININWTAAGSANLSLTKILNGCSSSASLPITIIDAPAPNVGGNIIVCSSGVETYTSGDNNASNGYSWTVVGGTFLPASGIGVNSINVTWGVAGTGSVSVQECAGGACPQAVNTTSTLSNIQIGTTPSIALTNSVVTPICANTTSQITVFAAQNLINYQLVLSGANNGTPLQGSGGSLTLTTADLPIVGVNDFTIKAYPEAPFDTKCAVTLTNHALVTVNPGPTASLAINPGFGVICDGNNTQLTLTFAGASTPYTFTITNGTSAESLSSGVTSYTYNPVVFPAWGGPTTSKDYTYSISNVTSGGCSNTGSNTVTVKVWKVPQTGQPYHIPNNFGL
jgi:hypothetical protein